MDERNRLAQLLVAVLLVAPIAAPADALVAQVLGLLPDGFPYLGGVCGIGVRVEQLDLAAGINCGNTKIPKSTFSCRSAPGGHVCNATEDGFGQGFRWINAAHLHAEMFGSCFDSKDATWQGLDGFLPVDLPLECSVSGFIPQGSCMTIKVWTRIHFDGAYAPADYVFGPDEGGLCP